MLANLESILASWGEVISVVITIATVLAFEFWYPSDQSGGVRQKRFWTVVTSTMTLILTLGISKLFDIHKELREARADVVTSGRRFAELLDADVQRAFQSMASSYHQHLEQGAHGSSPLFRDWVLYSLGNLQGDLAGGFVPMLPVKARDHMGNFLARAQSNLIATNITFAGQEEFFLENRGYVNNNKEAFSNRVPVVRFYLVDDSMDSNKFTQVQRKIAGLHAELRTVYSAIIRDGAAGMRDILLVDETVLLETEYLHGEQVQVNGTVERDKIRGAARYIVSLDGKIDDKDAAMVFRMNDEDVRALGNQGWTTADDVYRTVLSELRALAQ